MKETEVRQRESIFKQFFSLLDTLFEREERKPVKEKRAPRRYVPPKTIAIHQGANTKTSFEEEQEEANARQWRIAQSEYQRIRVQRTSPRQAALMRQVNEDEIQRQYQLATNTTLYMQHIAHMEAMQLENFHNNT